MDSSMQHGHPSQLIKNQTGLLLHEVSLDHAKIRQLINIKKDREQKAETLSELILFLLQTLRLIYAVLLAAL